MVYIRIASSDSRVLPAIDEHDRDHRLEEEAAEGSAIGVQELEVDQDEANELGTTSAMGNFAGVAAAIEVIDLVDADSEEPMKLGAATKMDGFTLTEEQREERQLHTQLLQHSSNCAGCKSTNCIKMKACAYILNTKMSFQFLNIYS